MCCPIDLSIIDFLGMRTHTIFEDRIPNLSDHWSAYNAQKIFLSIVKTSYTYYYTFQIVSC